MPVKKIFKKFSLDALHWQQTAAGLYNDSYIVTTKDNQYVLRIAPPDDTPQLFYEKHMMHSEPNMHSLLRQHTSIPAPAVCGHDFSRRIIDRDYIIMQFLPGRAGNYDDRELGQYVAQLHSLTGSVYGYPDRDAPTGREWPALFLKYAAMIFADCLQCGVLDKEEHDWFLQIFKDHQQAIKPVKPSLLHLDLWSQNILTDKGHITAILDFDRGLYGDPELEFAVLESYGAATPGFFSGYGQKRPDSGPAQTRRILYLVYELIKYAFIRTARGGSRSTGRGHVSQCRRILSQLDN